VKWSRLKTVPFCPDSFNPCQCVEVSSDPPIECIELAVEPRLGWYLPLEPGLTVSASLQPFTIRRPRTDLGNGYSFREGVGDIGEGLSAESRGVEEAMITMIFPNHQESSDHCNIQLIRPPTSPAAAQSIWPPPKYNRLSVMMRDKSSESLC
jgi:hypothetical protein